MKFEIIHEFDSTVDVLELAMMSPDLPARLTDHGDVFEAIETVEHQVDDGIFKRVWRYQARIPLPLKAPDLTHEVLSWEEHMRYDIQERRAQWHVVPNPNADPEASWRRRFDARGDYQLEQLDDGRSKRIVRAELDIQMKLKLIGSAFERVAITELRKAYDLEAQALRSLCTLP